MRAILRNARPALGALLAGAGTCASCHGPDGADARIARLEKQVSALTGQLEAQFNVLHTTGQGDAVFSWEQALSACFPEAARPFEKDMHGGFNEDPETGLVYTGIPGFGLCEISRDLRTWRVLGADPRLRANVHGIVCFKHGDVTRLALAQNEDERVLIVGLDGTVHQQLDAPRGGEFAFAEANAYYSARPIKQLPNGAPHRAKFACTDVTYLDGRLYVVTGYCDGDFVLTAREEAGGTWRWGPLAWGGKGDGAAQFRTAHGIFAHDDHIFVANREAHQVIEFTKTGELVRHLPDIPDTARICNVARAHDYFVFNALEPIRHTPARTAPIYAHSGERLLSTIEPGQLGIPVLKHLHHVWPHYVPNADGTKTLHLLLHGWSEGKFAVLKHEPNGRPSTPCGWNRTQDPL